MKQLAWELQLLEASGELLRCGNYELQVIGVTRLRPCGKHLHLRLVRLQLRLHLQRWMKLKTASSMIWTETPNLILNTLLVLSRHQLSAASYKVIQEAEVALSVSVAS
jgi:hypothetical protein